MTISTLKELYVDQLQDIYSADKQSKTVTQKLAEKASNKELKGALEAGVRGIDEGMDTLAKIIRSHGAEPNGEFCKGMEGLVKEAKAHAIDANIDDKDVMDASIIAQYQRMTHYALAGYGTARAFASRLELKDEAEKLSVCLDNTYSGDRTMTTLAQGGINEKAVA